MPTVPRATEPTVAQRPLAGGQLGAPATFAPSTQAQEAGNALLQVGAVIQQREDADKVFRAETQIKDQYLQWEAEAKQRRGQAAWGVAKEASTWWDENGAKVAGDLSGSQKAIFERTIAQLKTSSVGTFAGYEAGQRRESLDHSAQASIISSINLAAANPTNPELGRSVKDDIVRRNQVRASLNGWAPELADAKLAEDLTNLHKQVIQGLVRDDPAAAQAYFETNKAEIAGSQHAEIGAFASKATATRIGDTAAEAVWQKLGPKSDRDPVTLDTMEAQIRKDLTGKDEATKVAIAGLRERAGAFSASRKERDDQLEASVNQMLLDGKPLSTIRSTPAFLALSPESARKIADYAENRALRNEQRAALSDSRAQTRLGREGFGAYLQYSNPEVLAGMTDAQVINLLPLIGNDLTGHLMEKKRALSQGGKLAEGRMDEDSFKHVAREMSLPVDDKATPAQKEMMGEVKYRVERVIAAEQQRTGKPLNQNEKEDLMRREVARTVTVNPGIFSANKDVPVIGLSRDDVARVVIPTPDRKNLADAMRTMYARTSDARYAPTEDNLRRFFLLSKSPSAGMILPPKN